MNHCDCAPVQTNRIPACAPADDNFFEQYEPTRYLLKRLWLRSVVFPTQMNLVLLRFWLAKQRLLLAYAFQSLFVMEDES